MSEDHSQEDSFASIKSVKDATRLIFSDIRGESFTAELKSVCFSGRVAVSTYYSGSPSLLFDEMSLEWRGWRQEKYWADLDDCLRLTAMPSGN